MSLAHSILASVSIKGVYRRFAALSPEEQKAVADKVRERLQNKNSESGEEPSTEDSGIQVDTFVPEEESGEKEKDNSQDEGEGDDLYIPSIEEDGSEKSEDHNLLDWDDEDSTPEKESSSEKSEGYNLLDWDDEDPTPEKEDGSEKSEDHNLLDWDDEDSTPEKESSPEVKPAQSENTQKPEEKPQTPVEKPVAEALPIKDGSPAGKIVDEMEEDVEQIKQEGNLDNSKLIELFDSILKMHTLLLHSKPPKEVANPKTAGVVDRVANYYMANSEIIGRSGQQMHRKDKDMMDDTGGRSKGMGKEPDLKPPRTDVRKPFRTKNKPAEDRDSDTDKDLDKRKD